MRVEEKVEELHDTHTSEKVEELLRVEEKVEELHDTALMERSSGRGRWSDRAIGR